MSGPAIGAWPLEPCSPDRLRFGANAGGSHPRRVQPPPGKLGGARPVPCRRAPEPSPRTDRVLRGNVRRFPRTDCAGDLLRAERLGGPPLQAWPGTKNPRMYQAARHRCGNRPIRRDRGTRTLVPGFVGIPIRGASMTEPFCLPRHRRPDYHDCLSLPLRWLVSENRVLGFDGTPLGAKSRDSRAEAGCRFARGGKRPPRSNATKSRSYSIRRGRSRWIGFFGRHASRYGVQEGSVATSGEEFILWLCIGKWAFIPWISSMLPRDDTIL